MSASYPFFIILIALSNAIIRFIIISYTIFNIMSNINIGNRIILVLISVTWVISEYIAESKMFKFFIKSNKNERRSKDERRKKEYMAKNI